MLPSQASLVQVRSPQAWGFQLAAVPQRTQHVESSWARGFLVRMCHGTRRWWSLRTPDSAGQSQNSMTTMSILINQTSFPKSSHRCNQCNSTKRATPWAKGSRMKECSLGCPFLRLPLAHGVARFVELHWYETEEVAQYFNAGITPDHALGLDTSAESDPPLPSELNFAVSGTLSVTMHNTTRVCPEMKIAQGNRASTNNWCIAGTKCHHDYDGLMCLCGNHNVTFFDDGLGRTSNIFSVHFPIGNSKPAT